MQRVVISYDIACKYSIYFDDRMAHEAYPLLTAEEITKLGTIEKVWLVPKFHLGAHIEACADSYSFNITPDVGRTCGELVESNWSSLDRMARIIREEGFGNRKETVNDCMADWNYRKNMRAGKADYNELEDSYLIRAELTGAMISSQHIQALMMWFKRRDELRGLEGALPAGVLERYETERITLPGSQYRTASMESPTRADSLKKLNMAEEESNLQVQFRQARTLAGRIKLGSLVNMGLDLELRL